MSCGIKFTLLLAVNTIYLISFLGRFILGQSTEVGNASISNGSIVQMINFKIFDTLTISDSHVTARFIDVMNVFAFGMHSIPILFIYFYLYVFIFTCQYVVGPDLGPGSRSLTQNKFPSLIPEYKILYWCSAIKFY
jgi:hypothetical protein